MPISASEDKSSRPGTPSKSTTTTLGRTPSLSDRLRSSWKGGVVSSLRRKAPDATSSRPSSRASNRNSKLTKQPPSCPGSAASGILKPQAARPVIPAEDEKSKQEAVKLPTAPPSRKTTAEVLKTTADSATDRPHSTQKQRFRLSKAGKQRQQQAPAPLKKSNPKGGVRAVDANGEPVSFFDDGSSSEEEDDSPVIQRASSVRIGKPTLVRHAGAVGSKVGLETALKEGPDMASAVTEPVEVVKTDERDASETVDGPSDALKKLEGATAVRDAKALPSPPATTTRHPQSMLGGELTSSPASTVFSSSAYGSTGPDSDTSESTAAEKPPISITTPLSPLSALRSNPITPTTISSIHFSPASASAHLSRTLSAPLPPNRNPNRRVTIRPSDLVIHHTEHDHKLFRDGVITTPYPGTGSDNGKGLKRLSDIPDSADNSTATSPTMETAISGPLPTSTGTTARDNATKADKDMSLLSPRPIPLSPHGPGDRDRFPSTVEDEVLRLTLSLAGHPDLITTIEIPIPASPPISSIPAGTLRSHRPNASTRNRLSRVPFAATAAAESTTEDQAHTRGTAIFDDAALFTALYTHHRRLLGPLRRCFPTRKLSFAALATENSNIRFDAPAFLTHLHNPKLGAGKVGWVMWLRYHQDTSPSSQPARNDAPSNNTPRGLGVSGVRMPFQPLPPSPSPSHNNNNNKRPSSGRVATASAVHVVLHYRFNAPVIAGLLLVLAALSVVSVMLWVLVGVPGLGAGQHAPPPQTVVEGTAAGNATTAIGDGVGDVMEAIGSPSYGAWRVDAQMRVLTGLVLGLEVFVVGMVGVVGWVFGGWVLL